MGTLVHLCMLPVHIEECVKYFAVSERHMHMCARPFGVGPGGQTFPCRAALLRVLGLLPKKHGGIVNLRKLGIACCVRSYSL